jgi:hypothetical protein
MKAAVSSLNPPQPPFHKGGASVFSSFLLLLQLLVLLLVPQLCQAALISNYRVIRESVTDAAGKARVAIRSFDSDGVPHLLVVDPASLETADLPASALRPAGAAADRGLAKSRYLTAVERHTSAPFPLQNDGATRAEKACDGVFLTVDLCPSKRPFERELFESSQASGDGAPVPVAVAITGLWLDKHPEELSYLKKEVAAGRLAITWVNHSHSHPYEPKTPLAHNFLLTAGTDLTSEILEVEQRLLANGLVPSPFFRFPGLVSDQGAMKRLRELSLIPIGSDAWLAKGEHPVKGSFILVHGNGNEPKGISLILPMLKRKELRLLPLASAFKE